MSILMSVVIPFIIYLPGIMFGFWLFFELIKEEGFTALVTFLCFCLYVVCAGLIMAFGNY